MSKSEHSPPPINPIMWCEIYVDDLNRAIKFYRDLLGVKIEKMPANYDDEIELAFFEAQFGLAGAMGSLVKHPAIKPGAGGSVIYFETEDCGKAAERAVSLGGEICLPKKTDRRLRLYRLGI